MIRRRASYMKRYLGIAILVTGLFLLLSQPKWSLQEIYCPVAKEIECPPAIRAENELPKFIAPALPAAPAVPSAQALNTQALPVPEKPSTRSLHTHAKIEVGDADTLDGDVDYMNRLYALLSEMRQLSDGGITNGKVQTIKRLINGSLSILKHLLDKGSSNKLSPLIDHEHDVMETKIDDQMETIGLCPEVYKSSTYGYPFFYKGFEETECDYVKPLSSMITAVFCLIDYTATDLLQLLDSFSKVYPSVKQVILITVQQDTAELRTRLPSEVNVKVMGTGVSLAAAWTTALNEVRTPFLLAANQLREADGNMNLRRLIRASIKLGSPVMGGAVRSSDGRWQMACQQASMKNYTLVYRHGYHHSAQECVFCNYTSSPIVMSTTFAQRTSSWNPHMDSSHLLFRDFFMQITSLNYYIAICPDAMFEIVGTHDPVLPREAYLPFVQQWNINHLVFPNGSRHIYTCEESGVSRGLIQGGLVAPCRLEYLAQGIHIFMAGCEQIGIICELEEGTLMGAVKLGKILPWEKDADVTVFSSDVDRLVKNRDIFVKSGLRIDLLAPTRCCDENRTTGGILKTHFQGWTIEIWGQHRMDSEVAVPTKVLLDGMWVNTPRNPGLYIRNRYGREIYQHAEHWMARGTGTGWAPYDTSLPFTRCAKPGGHFCLDQYKTDGNLQFEDPVP